MSQTLHPVYVWGFIILVCRIRCKASTLDARHFPYHQRLSTYQRPRSEVYALDTKKWGRVPYDRLPPWLGHDSIPEFSGWPRPIKNAHGDSRPAPKHATQEWNWSLWETMKRLGGSQHYWTLAGTHDYGKSKASVHRRWFQTLTISWNRFIQPKPHGTGRRDEKWENGTQFVSRHTIGKTWSQWYAG
jgi:hypothetical protein